MTDFLDTNVFLYAARPGSAADRAKQPVAMALIGADDVVLSAQVMAEFYTNATRGPDALPAAAAEEWLDFMADLPCVPLTSATVLSGVALAGRYRINYWDGAILAAAHEAGATRLYTEDLSDGQRYGSVTVVNPFRSAVRN
jgi:predicted nucleic acid-binding protein